MIGESGSIAPIVDAKWVFDNQSATTITETNQLPFDADGSFWLGKDGDQNEFFVVDLGQAWSIDNIRLFNSHNSTYDDRWVGDFIISGANSVTPIISGETGASGYDLTGSITQLVSGTLTRQFAVNDPIEPQNFTPSTAAAFRYLRFETLAGNSGSSQALNEMMVFGSPLPEPSTYALIAAGVGVLLLRKRRAL